jgi:hypothetical protein
MRGKSNPGKGVTIIQEIIFNSKIPEPKNKRRRK